MFNRASRLAGGLTILAAVVCTSCQLMASLTVAALPDGEGLAFHLTGGRGGEFGELLSVSVYRCASNKSSFAGRGELVWRASVPAGATGPIVGEFLYGKDLEALRTSDQPASLDAGCYVAHAYARFPDQRAAVAVFDILANGSIVARAVP